MRRECAEARVARRSWEDSVASTMFSRAAPLAPEFECWGYC